MAMRHRRIEGSVPESFQRGTIQGFCGTGSYEKLQVKKEGRSCAVFPWIGAVACRIRAEPEATEDLQVG